MYGRNLRDSALVVPIVWGPVSYFMIPVKRPSSQGQKHCYGCWTVPKWSGLAGHSCPCVSAKNQRPDDQTNHPSKKCLKWQKVHFLIRSNDYTSILYLYLHIICPGLFLVFFLSPRFQILHCFAPLFVKEMDSCIYLWTPKPWTMKGRNTAKKIWVTKLYCNPLKTEGNGGFLRATCNLSTFDCSSKSPFEVLDGGKAGKSDDTPAEQRTWVSKQRKPNSLDGPSYTNLPTFHCTGWLIGMDPYNGLL